MKKIVTGKELQENILKSIDILCGTVKKTLGPKGNNVLIDHSNFSPFITNDGVTIAKNIESDDAEVGAILEIIKEASIKTNEIVGDGTTTTLVLLESLYLNSIEYIKEGYSPILLKKELENVLKIIIEELEKLKRKAHANDLKNIAIIAANDEKLGTLAYQVIKKVGKKEAVTIKEVSQVETKILYLKGYSSEIILASPYFLKDVQKLNYQNTLVLIMNTPLTDLEYIGFLLNDIFKTKQNLLIIANNYSNTVVEELVSFNLNENVPICLLKIAQYGKHVYEIMKDIACITNATIIEQENNITSKDIGLADDIEITEDNIRINFKVNKKTKEYLTTLKKTINLLTNDLDEEFYTKRVAMFSKGIAQIQLASPTKTEGLEKRIRLEDALGALSVASHGILPGGGISLLKVANKLDEENVANKIWKDALTKPFEQILKNAGLNYSDIQKQIEQKNYKEIFNINNNLWENILNTKVMDPFLVINQALINATSIAGMLLTTSSLIINEYKNNINKESDYSNLED